MKMSREFGGHLLFIYFWAAVSALQAASVADLTYDSSGDHITITECRRSASGTLTIPEQIDGKPVTAIGEGAFNFCNSLAEVHLPDSLVSMGPTAFFACGSLNTIDFGSGLSEIPREAFRSCWAIETLIIPGTIKSIGERSFSDCTNLTSLTISSGVEVIGKHAFYGVDMESLTLPKSISTIETGAFTRCRFLSNLNISPANPNFRNEDGVIYSADNATLVIYPAGLTLTTFTIPENVTTIAGGAFEETFRLTEIIFGSALKVIEERAFASVKIASALLPDTMITIGRWCKSLSVKASYEAKSRHKAADGA